MMTETAWCEHMKGGTPDFCDALDKPYMPDVSRMKEYCKCSNHRSCSFRMYRAYRKAYFDQRRPKADRGSASDA